MESLLKQLETQLEGELLYDNLHKMIYATDASVYRKIPQAVAYPKSERDIKHLIDFATQNKTSLIPRTAGTSLAGQCVGEGIVVDVSKYFNSILSVDTSKKTVKVQPGVIRDELNQYLKPYGLFFGPNTSTSNRCMIGGMVGNNSSGTTSIQYGVTRDKIVSLKTILSNGDEAHFSALTKEEFYKKTELNTLEGLVYNEIYKNFNNSDLVKEINSQFPKKDIHRRNTGYAVDALLETNVFTNSEKKINVAHLLCGSEGTLAFTTEIELQLDVLPPSETLLIAAHYNTLESCLNDVSNVMKHNLYTCEMMDDVILNCTKNNKLYDSYRFFIQGEPKALLLLELRDTSKVALQDQRKQLEQSLKESNLGYAFSLIEGDNISKVMALRKAGLGLLGNLIGDKKAVACIEDTAVALNDLPEFISEFTALMKKHKQQAVYYAHAGAGELHLRPILNLKSEEDVLLFRQITTEVAYLTKKYKGSFSGEHGDGIVRAEFIPMLVGDLVYSFFKTIKTTFDPNGIFNPHKIVDAYKMDENLRYSKKHIEPNINTTIDFSDSEGILKLAEKCNGSGDCRKTDKASGTMCPSYQASKDEKDTTRARANVLREVLTNNVSKNKFDNKELKQVMDMCLSCKACSSECPSTVDISLAKAEFLHQYYKSNTRSISNYVLGHASLSSKITSKTPKLWNFVYTNKFLSSIIKMSTGVAQQRSLPLVSEPNFSKRTLNKTYTAKTKREVFLFVDEFSEYLDASIAEDAYVVLKALGYKVTVINNLDSARAYLSKGFVGKAKKQIDINIKTLQDKVSSQSPLIGIEPSAILGFRDEYVKLASNKEQAKNIAQHSYLIEEFLANEFNAKVFDSSYFTVKSQEIKIHVHCHQKALANQKCTFDVLNIPKNYNATLIASGCCGMAGSFGYEKKHYATSMKIGKQRLFPKILKSESSTLIAANGTSCRHQIIDGTQRTALHPITILRKALN